MARSQKGRPTDRTTGRRVERLSPARCDHSGQSVPLGDSARRIAAQSLPATAGRNNAAKPRRDRSEDATGGHRFESPVARQPLAEPEGRGSFRGGHAPEKQTPPPNAAPPPPPLGARTA